MSLCSLFWRSMILEWRNMNDNLPCFIYSFYIVSTYISIQKIIWFSHQLWNRIVFFIIDPTYRLLQYRLFAHTTLNNHWMCSSIQPGCKALDKTPMRLNRQIIQTGSKSLRTHRDKCPIANTDWKSSKRSTTKVIFSLVGHGGGHLRRGEEAPPVLTIVHMCTRW